MGELKERLKRTEEAFQEEQTKYSLSERRAKKAEKAFLRLKKKEAEETKQLTDVVQVRPYTSLLYLKLL